MGKFCCNCGAPLGDDDLFCTSCGTKVEAEAGDMNAQFQEATKQEETPTYEEAPKYEETPKYEEAPKQEAPRQEAPKTEYQETKTVNTAGITERSIVLAIIFSIISCGIYYLYWVYKMNEDINQLVGDTGATSGGLVILFSIISCGIYGWYWYYKMGEKIDNMTGSDSHKILFIVLAIFGLGIVNLAIMQDAVNKEIAK